MATTLVAGCDRSGKFTVGNKLAVGRRNPGTIDTRRRAAALTELTPRDVADIIGTLRRIATDPTHPHCAKVGLELVKLLFPHGLVPASVVVGEVRSNADRARAMQAILNGLAAGEIGLNVAKTLADLIERAGDAADTSKTMLEMLTELGAGPPG